MVTKCKWNPGSDLELGKMSLPFAIKDVSGTSGEFE